MDSNDEFLVSSRERAASRAQLVNTGNTSENIEKLIKEINTQKEENKAREELRLSREIAYKRTLEKDMENIRDRLEFVTKEYYTFKNEV